jgi:hypothetical protein
MDRTVIRGGNQLNGTAQTHGAGAVGLPQVTPALSPGSQEIDRLANSGQMVP